MERINYPAIVRTILQRHSTPGLHRGETALHLICDTESDRYQVLHLGWDGPKRIFGCIAYVTIQNGKIWIERDGTELGIATELLQAGIPPTDIVLGFHAPDRRALTEFATG